jgi:hypothetical protein
MFLDKYMTEIITLCLQKKVRNLILERNYFLIKDLEYLHPE